MDGTEAVPPEVPEFLINFEFFPLRQGRYKARTLAMRRGNLASGSEVFLNERYPRIVGAVLRMWIGNPKQRHRGGVGVSLGIKLQAGLVDTGNHEPGIAFTLVRNGFTKHFALIGETARDDLAGISAGGNGEGKYLEFSIGRMEFLTAAIAPRRSGHQIAGISQNESELFINVFVQVRTGRRDRAKTKRDKQDAGADFSNVRD